MADALDNPEESDLPKSDAGGEISELRGMIERLREEMRQNEDQLVSKVLGKIRLQGGGTVTVSGENGNWTITGTGPTGGTVTGTFDCDSDPPIFNGTVSLG